MTPSEQPGDASTPGFRTTLIRVMVVQIIALILLWVLQARYHG